MMKLKFWTLLFAFIFLFTACSTNGSETETSGLVESSEMQVEESQEQDLLVTTNENRLVLLDNILRGGPPPDGIPPIDEPVYESVEEASRWLNNHDKVFIYETPDLTYVFPQRILVWHEIVNVKDGDNDFAMTYCPLTGSAICYFYPLGYDTSYGTSGMLINSNLLMYDRATDAFISQIDGVGLTEDLSDVELFSGPAFWTDWHLVALHYPQAQVLSRDTGFLRNYSEDPYGTYTPQGPTGYYADQGTIFPPIHEDDQAVFSDKYPVIGVKDQDHHMALDPLKVKASGTLAFDLNQSSYQAIYDVDLDVIRVFNSPDGLSLTYVDKTIVSDQGHTWTLLGKALNDNHDDLTNPIYFEVMWFAWYAFYPETEVIQ